MHKLRLFALIAALCAGLVSAADSVIAPEAAAQVRYAQVIAGSANVYEALNPTSPVIGMAMRGTSFELVSAGDIWCKVKYRGREGWVEHDLVEIVDKPNKSFMVKDFLIVFSILGGLLAMLSMVILISRLRNRVKGEWFEVEARPEKKVLIVSTAETRVKRFLDERESPLPACFSDLGCVSKTASGAQDFQRQMITQQPDILAVDWLIASNVQAVTEQILGARSASVSVFTIFYNVPDPSNIEKSRVIPNTAYLPIGFTEQDLIRVISMDTTGISRGGTDEIRKSVESSALQGDIGEGSLSAIFQFIEMGRKTGCLMIEDEKPAGIVYFNEGVIIHAVSRRGSGRKAVMDLLGTNNGIFRFVLDKRPRSETMQLPALAVLLDWARENDEATGSGLRQA